MKIQLIQKICKDCPVDERAELANFLYEKDFQVCSYKKWTLSMWGGHILLGERVWRVVKQNVKWIHSLLMTLKRKFVFRWSRFKISSLLPMLVHFWSIYVHCAGFWGHKGHFNLNNNPTNSKILMYSSFCPDLSRSFRFLTFPVKRNTKKRKKIRERIFFKNVIKVTIKLAESC